MPKRTKRPKSPLTGDALIIKVKELDDLSREEKAIACGYTTPEKGSTKVNMMAFLNALVAAEGLNLDAQNQQTAQEGRGKKPSYRIRVHSNGQLIINAAYTKLMNLDPGVEFELILKRKQIHLKPISET